MNKFLHYVFDVGPGILALGSLGYTAVSWKKFNHNERSWWVFGTMCCLLAWAFMNSMQKVADAWASPQYSHGFLIPVLAVALLYMRRKDFIQEVPTKHQAIGLGIIVVCMVLRIWSSERAFMTVDRFMIVPAILGVMLMVGGLPALKWAAAPIAFLVFMFPFPRKIEQMLSIPLQGWATRLSHFALETLGVECFTEGNRIMLDGMEMGVVDACSGLRMLTIFGALSAGVAMISVNRPWWERLIILVSAIPIALAVNSIRITLTGLAYNFLGNESELIRIVNTVAHDFAGLIMMPMALGLLYLEYQILSHLVIEEETEQLSPTV